MKFYISLAPFVPSFFAWLFLSAAAISSKPLKAPANAVQNFLFIGGDADKLDHYAKLLNNPKIQGVQIVYTWQELEPTKDNYDFSVIKSNLAYLETRHKKLFIQIQDRFFTKNAKYVPAYLLVESGFSGGLTPQIDNGGGSKKATQGWVTVQWNAKVRARFQKLIKVLGANFDGKIYGINLPETAIDIDMKNDKTGFTCDKYFQSILQNIQVTKMAFKHSYVVQYVNFLPCEWDNSRKYMSRLFDFAKQNSIGLGGPDIVPYVYATNKFDAEHLNKAPYKYQHGIANSQMHNAYAFFHKYKSQLAIVAMAVQAPDYVYINPKTKKHFTVKEFRDFAINYLGVNIIFWTADKKILLP